MLLSQWPSAKKPRSESHGGLCNAAATATTLIAIETHKTQVVDVSFTHTHKQLVPTAMSAARYPPPHTHTSRS